MPILAYIAVMLVSIGGILFELDWLTKPKLETKPAMQTSSASAPAPVPRAVVKPDGPSAELNPIYPKKSDAPQPVENSAQAELAEQPAPETTGKAAAETTPSPDIAATHALTTASTTALTPVSLPAQSPPAAAVAAPPAAQPVSTAAKNKCDIQGCAGAYKSFRASDCTYQPFEGLRQLCVKPPETTRAAAQPREPTTEAAARRLSKDAELREVERTVRALPRDDVADFERDPFDDGDRRVIVIRRQGARW
jgi:hypothetical protein